ncbi:MAG: zinc ribbon domain-containing protein [Betaproteobacteria bacterium]|nr:zinc ribbon domain-containing protein [Betaproteobacteria bacterium]
MPIYAYRCESCGFAKDVLQKISDPVLTDCPSCGQAKFQKQVTAAGFQLKGSGWYVTDFRDGSSAKPAGGAEATPGGETKPAASTDAAAPAAPAPVAAAPAAATPSTAPAPAAPSSTAA